MTFLFLVRAFDVIFVLAEVNKAGGVHERAPGGTRPASTVAGANKAGGVRELFQWTFS